MADNNTRSSYSNAKAERLETRLSSEQKRLIQHAANLQNVSLTDFVVSNLQDAAMKTIHEHELINLHAEDRAALLNALFNPPEPNENLKLAFKRYQEEVEF